MPKSGICLNCGADNGNVAEFDKQNSVQTVVEATVAGFVAVADGNQQQSGNAANAQEAVKERQDSSTIETSVNESVAIAESHLRLYRYRAAQRYRSMPSRRYRKDTGQAQALLPETAANASNFLEEQQFVAVIETSASGALVMEGVSPMQALLSEKPQAAFVVEMPVNESVALLDTSLLPADAASIPVFNEERRDTASVESVSESITAADSQLHAGGHHTSQKCRYHLPRRRYQNQVKAPLSESAEDFVEEQQIPIVEAPVTESVVVADEHQDAVKTPSFDNITDASYPIEEQRISFAEAAANEVSAVANNVQTAMLLPEQSEYDVNTLDSLEEQQQALELDRHELEPSLAIDDRQLISIEEQQKTLNDKELANEPDEVTSDSALTDPYAFLSQKGKINYPLSKGNSAKLDFDEKKIIESCEGVFEQLKGKLVSKGNRYKALMVTSANPKDGVTVSSVAIAVALARYGHSNVLLIDANSDNQGISKLFSLADTAGFFEYMAGEESVNDVDSHETIADAFDLATESVGENFQQPSWTQSIFYTEYKNLFVMPFAKEKNASLWNLIDHAGVRERLYTLRQHFDFIIIDSPAIMKSSEAQILAAYLDGVIFVIKAEKTKWEVAKIALNNIENSGGKVIGSILNRRKYYIPKFLYGWM